MAFRPSKVRMNMTTERVKGASFLRVQAKNEKYESELCLPVIESIGHKEVKRARRVLQKRNLTHTDLDAIIARLPK